MNKLLVYILIGVLLFLTLITLEIFFPGIDFILWPLLGISALVLISGFITIPIGLYRLLKKQILSNRLIISIGLSLGIVLGSLIQKPINKWDNKQRNISGVILTSEIEKYRHENGYYPENLSKLDLKEINQRLANNYKANRFHYFLHKEEYYLDVPILIFDSWRWNKEKNEFEYNDF